MRHCYTISLAEQKAPKSPLSGPIFAQRPVEAELIAVLVAVNNESPRVLTLQSGQSLPAGPFEFSQRSLQSSLRAWVERQTGHPLGYVEQLYTFADRNRFESERWIISISYLGLTRESNIPQSFAAGWEDWYQYFPWEDHRHCHVTASEKVLAPLLEAWADRSPSDSVRSQRRHRIAVTFGLFGGEWNEELVLQRYELLYEAGLTAESRDPHAAGVTVTGVPMRFDHRRILATGIARLRAKIKYRPVVFELMPESFTLLQLQRTVEALAGRGLHKQNFRRLIDQQKLVEETGDMLVGTGGRPAKLFRFRRAILLERAVAGTKLPVVRGP